MLDYRWSHNPPFYWRIGATGWLQTHTFPKFCHFTCFLAYKSTFEWIFSFDWVLKVLSDNGIQTHNHLIATTCYHLQLQILHLLWARKCTVLKVVLIQFKYVISSYNTSNGNLSFWNPFFSQFIDTPNCLKESKEADTL